MNGVPFQMGFVCAFSFLCFSVAVRPVHVYSMPLPLREIIAPPWLISAVRLLAVSALSIFCLRNSVSLRIVSDRFASTPFHAFTLRLRAFLFVSFSSQVLSDRCLRRTDRLLDMPCRSISFHNNSDSVHLWFVALPSDLVISGSSHSRSSRCFSDSHRFPSDHFFSDSSLSARGGAFQVRCASFRIQALPRRFLSARSDTVPMHLYSNQFRPVPNRLNSGQLKSFLNRLCSDQIKSIPKRLCSALIVSSPLQ